MSRAIFPREHGAYFELGFPLLSSLTVVAPTGTSVAFAVAALLLFLSHESLAIVSGVRGRRARQESGDRARHTFLILAGTGVVVGGTGMVFVDPDVRLAALVPLGLVGVLVPWVVRRRQKSLVAELVVVGVFATVVFPVGMAGQMTWRMALLVTAVWLGSFIPSTVTVHALKLHHKGRPAALPMRLAGLGTALLVAGGGVTAAAAGKIPALAAVALLPPAGAACGLSAWPVHPRNLRRVGWTLVVTGALTWICLLFL
jgi:hypothetical protein